MKTKIIKTHIASGILFFGVSAPLFAQTEARTPHSPVIDSATMHLGCQENPNQITWYKKDAHCAVATHQASLIYNVSRDTLMGNQLAFLANIGSEKVGGHQIAAGLNYAGETRWQLGLSANIARKVESFQIGSCNFADTVQGSQIALNINFARRVKSFQIGGWNIADTVLGTQIGFVNIAHEVQGASIAFFTLAGNGLFHLDMTTDEAGMGRLTFATGKTFYTAYSFGYTPDADNHPFALGMGIGYHKDIGLGYGEAEIASHMIVEEGVSEKDFRRKTHDDKMSQDGINSLFQAKVRFGHRLLGPVGLFAGATFNALYHGDTHAVIQPWSDGATQHTHDVDYWPGIEIGLRFGK